MLAHDVARTRRANVLVRRLADGCHDPADGAEAPGEVGSERGILTDGENAARSIAPLTESPLRNVDKLKGRSGIIVPDLPFIFPEARRLATSSRGAQDRRGGVPSVWLASTRHQRRSNTHCSG